VKFTAFVIAGLTLGASAFAQTTPRLYTPSEQAASPSFYRATVTRTVEAVNYEHKQGSTKVGFAGTSLMPMADGWARVESKRGNLEINAEFGSLQKPETFGGEYLTYILWAISPEGRAVNLGEVLVGGNDRSKIRATTDLQAFALIVTAEPYYAVREPSNAVVLENVVREDTRGTAEPVQARYELMERGGYLPTGYKFDPVVLNAKLPLEFFEARNAVRIAKSEGAEEYAADSYRHATDLMSTADSEATTRGSSQHELIATSREAVQTAEDARAIAVKKLDEAHLNSERQASADAQTAAQAQTDAANAQNAQAQADAAKAQAQTDAANAQSTQAQADAAKAQADLAAGQAASAAAVTAAQADADTANANAQAAQQAAQSATNDKAAMRAQLTQQLNAVLQTRDTARGVIVNMSDVLFDTGKFSLSSGAREKLAKVAGILVSFPGLAIEVGGYTDNVGSDDMNQKLSENRADAVRDYLVKQGVLQISAVGYGNTAPVAANDNATGRQQNRRVELVVSGDAIGSAVTTSSLQLLLAWAGLSPAGPPRRIERIKPCLEPS
jgi:outer membrane protein OmpA-like peptidoglycan-associated protein